MNKSMILVVEDDVRVRNLMTTTLKLHDYKYETASCGKEALTQTLSSRPDIVLLDLGLPDIDGKEVIATIRSWSQVPIVVVSARSEDHDKIDALDLGADDYLTKPFSVDELLARLRVVERRLQREKYEDRTSSMVKNGHIEMDLAAGIVRVNRQELHLTPIEYKILTLLMKNIDKVLTHTQITSHIWGHSEESDVAGLRVYMAGLRKKIERLDPISTYIQTHIGVGYRMQKVDLIEKQ